MVHLNEDEDAKVERKLVKAHFVKDVAAIKRLFKKYVPKNTKLVNVETECANKDIHGNNIHCIINSPFVNHISNVELVAPMLFKNFPQIRKILIKIVKKLLTKIQLILQIQKSFQRHFKNKRYRLHKVLKL